MLQPLELAHRGAQLADAGVQLCADAVDEVGHRRRLSILVAAGSRSADRDATRGRAATSLLTPIPDIADGRTRTLALNAEGKTVDSRLRAGATLEIRILHDNAIG
jgi:hypothetical protein